MSTRTRAAVVETAGGPFVVTDVELDEPRTGEVLVRLVATGLCHTDLGVRAGFLPLPLPAVVGHEGAGVVEAVGPDTPGVAVGDRVVLSFRGCGACAACTSGHPAHCPRWLPLNVFAGGRDDGSMPVTRATDGPGAGEAITSMFFGQSSLAERTVADARSVVVLDPATTEDDLRVLAPLGCGVQTGFGSVRQVLRAGPGRSLAVFGAGAVGLSGVIAAHLAGAVPLVAIDVVPARLELATRLGATHVIDAGREDVPARLAEITGGTGLDLAFDTTGHPGVARTALDALAIGGTLAVCGAPPPGTEIPVDIQGILPGKTLVGVTMGSVDPQVVVPELVALHAAGQLPLELLIGHYAFDDVEAAARAMHEGTTVKPVVVF